MMKAIKKILALVACLAVAGMACAQGTAKKADSEKSTEKTAEKSATTKKSSSSGIGMYAKGSLGYQFYAPKKDDVYFESNCFELTPTFGIFPIAGNKNFALEASLDMNFGGKDEVSTRVFAPQVMAIFYTPLTDVLQGVSLPDFLKKLTPYWGLGFSLPIETVEIFIFSETDVKFRMNLSAGAKYDITDKIAATLDFNAGLFNSWAWSIRAGAIYTIK